MAQKRMEHEDYLALNEAYKEKLISLMDEYGHKRCQVLGLSQSTVASWKARKKSVPDVVVGAAIAREFATTVEEMVYGERAPVFYPSKKIAQIVDLLTDNYKDEDFLSEAVGMIKCLRAQREYHINNEERDSYVAER